MDNQIKLWMMVDKSSTANSVYNILMKNIPRGYSVHLCHNIDDIAVHDHFCFLLEKEK